MTLRVPLYPSWDINKATIPLLGHFKGLHTCTGTFCISCPVCLFFRYFYPHSNPNIHIISVGTMGDRGYMYPLASEARGTTNGFIPQEKWLTVKNLLKSITKNGNSLLFAKFQTMRRRLGNCFGMSIFKLGPAIPKPDLSANLLSKMS